MRGLSHRERVLRSLDRRGYDRIPVKHAGTPEIDRELMGYFRVDDREGLLSRLGDDFRYVSPCYVGPELKTFPDGSWEGYWGERYRNVSFGAGVYAEAVHLPYKNVMTVAELDHFHHPTADWFDCSTIRAQCEAWHDYAVVFGGPGDLDFMNGIARYRGVEQVIVDIGLRDPVFRELVERRFRFFYELHERALQAAGGRIDLVHVGEDLGNQNGLMISPVTFDELFAPKLAAFFGMAHRYGARVMMHACGSVRGLIGRLIELGLDVLDVVQVSATGMGIVDLARSYRDRLSFCGSVCVQTTLPFGSTADVRREVELRKDLFADGGLILGPTHAIQVGTPLANVVAMYESAGSLVM